MSLGQYVVTAITLTADGWKFIGRTPPAISEAALIAEYGRRCGIGGGDR